MQPDRSPPDLNALARFAAVVEAGSFSAAARRLGLSRQAVHRSVEQLEASHGVQLIERTTRSLRLTDAGRRLVEPARAAQAAGRQADALLTAATARPSGRLRLSAPPLFADAVLSRALPAFVARWPEVVVEASFVAARTHPRRDDFDVTLRIGAAPPEDAYAVRLGQAGLVLCASASWLATHDAPTHPDQLPGHPLLAYGLDPRPWSFDGPEGSVSVRVQPRLRTDSATVMVQACLDGLGILNVPMMAVSEPLRTGALRRVLPDWRIPSAEVWAIYGHRTAGDPTIAAFLDAMRATTWDG